MLPGDTSALLIELTSLSTDGLEPQVVVDRALRLLIEVLGADVASLRIARTPDGPLTTYGGREAGGRTLGPSDITFKPSSVIPSRAYDARPAPTLMTHRERQGWLHVSVPLRKRYHSQIACLGILSLMYRDSAAHDVATDASLLEAVGSLMAALVFEVDEMQYWRDIEIKASRP